MNSLVYADIPDRDASKASSISSTTQQLSLAFGSLVVGWFLGHVNQIDPAQAVPALHKAFLALGAVTIVSSLTFWGLKPNDGNNVSNRRPSRPAAIATP